MCMCVQRCYGTKSTDRTTKIDSFCDVCAASRFSLAHSFHSFVPFSSSSSSSVFSLLLVCAVVFHPHFLFKHLSAWIVSPLPPSLPIYISSNTRNMCVNVFVLCVRCVVSVCTKTDQHSVDINLKTEHKRPYKIFICMETLP